MERFEHEPWLFLSDQEIQRQIDEKLDRLHSRWGFPSSRRRSWRLRYPKDHGVRFARVGDLLDHLQQDYENGLYYAVLEECQGCRLLVLDDLGHQRETPWRVEIVDRIVDARYRTGRWTVVTTNLPGDQLPLSHSGASKSSWWILGNSSGCVR